ncbi:MAG: hypothetical protein L0216_08160, partial [Planctomycetales bacterium]|nr:hypothetical protein [Planctomycetales bacterium]
VIADSMAGAAMKAGRVRMVLVGADRIARNGDVANKIGTYGLAVLARAHKVPFAVAAPSSTFDLSIGSGAGIPIEERDPAEILRPGGLAVAPDGVPAWNPAFDVTPARLISAIVTDRGVIRKPGDAAIARLLGARPAPRRRRVRETLSSKGGRR